MTRIVSQLKATRGKNCKLKQTIKPQTLIEKVCNLYQIIISMYIEMANIKKSWPVILRGKKKIKNAYEPR